MISEHDAIGHPDSNKITRALGMTPDVEVELRDEALEIYEGDSFVLVDTAGLRRPGKRKGRTERGSALMTLRSLERADVALLLVDIAR